MNASHQTEPRSVVARLSDTLDSIARWVQVIGAVVLFGVMIFTFVVVIARYVFNTPIRGDVELTQLASVAIVWLGVAWGQVCKSHLKVDLLVGRLSPRTSVMVETGTYLMIIAVVAIMVWQGISNAMYVISVGKITNAASLPLGPSAVMIPVGASLLLVVLLRDLLRNLTQIATMRVKNWQWVLIVGVPLVLLAFMYAFMQPSLQGLLPASTTALIGILVGLVFVFLGMPIGPALAIAGFVFVGNILNAKQGFGLAGADLFWQSADYSWSTIMLFILMSEFIVVSGIGVDAFTTAYRWIGRLRGGLAIATIAGCTLLAAVVGIPAPVIYAMGAVALPQMRKYNYSDVLSGGVISCGSCLGPLIPPSVSFIFYGIFTGESIGEMFIAGIIPGLILSSAFMTTIYVWCRVKPETAGVSEERFSWGEKFRSLKISTPISLLFILVMGGIYMGVFTTTEGGGIGAFLALVIALAMRRIGWLDFKKSVMSAARICAVMIFMVLGSMMLGRVLTVGGVGDLLSGFLGGLSPALVGIAVLIFFFIMGFFMDTITVMILTLPILAPILKDAGIDMVWFGVVLVMVINIGAYTPPYGLNNFILAGATDLKLATIFRGVMPFVITNVLVCALLFLVPEIVTWLPSVLR